MTMSVQGPFVFPQTIHSSTIVEANTQKHTEDVKNVKLLIDQLIQNRIQLFIFNESMKEHGNNPGPFFVSQLAHGKGDEIMLAKANADFTAGLKQMLPGVQLRQGTSCFTNCRLLQAFHLIMTQA
jgi:hypothetical protein